jgi:aspartyl protease family protein
MMGGLDPQSQARFFYLAILGVVLTASALALYRGRIAQGAQHLMIWGLILAGLVIAYGFRGQLAEGLAPAGATVEAGDRIALRRGRDGHFAATLEVNGAPVRFLVDTGATSMVLARDDARRVGIDLDGLIYSVPSMTANGPVYSAPVRLAEVRFGPHVDRDVAATVSGGGLGISLLGMGYLDRFRSLTIEGDRMLLER